MIHSVSKPLGFEGSKFWENPQIGFEPIDHPPGQASQNHRLLTPSFASAAQSGPSVPLWDSPDLLLENGAQTKKRGSKNSTGTDWYHWISRLHMLHISKYVHIRCFGCWKRLASGFHIRLQLLSIESDEITWQRRHWEIDPGTERQSF